MPSLNTGRLKLPTSPKVIAGSGAALLSTAFLGGLAEQYLPNLDPYLRYGLVAIVASALTFAAGWLVKHDVISQGLANALFGNVDSNDHVADDEPTAGDATHVNVGDTTESPITVADAIAADGEPETARHRAPTPFPRSGGDL